MTEEREKALRFVASSPDIYGITAPITEELFKEIDDLRYKLALTEGQRDNESGVLELVAETRDIFRKALEEIRDSQEPWEPQRTIAMNALETE